MRRLGIDPGSTRTGVAVSEDGLGVALPLCTLNHTTLAEAVRAVAQVIADERIDEVVLGLPLALDGREGQAAKRARQFAEQLGTLIRTPVVLWDERLSTAGAERALKAQGLAGKQRRSVVDQAAATLILQSYLDSHRDDTWDDEPEPLQDDQYETARPNRPRRRSR